jgi:hypothetical protein
VDDAEREAFRQRFREPYGRAKQTGDTPPSVVGS